MKRIEATPEDRVSVNVDGEEVIDLRDEPVVTSGSSSEDTARAVATKEKEPKPEAQVAPSYRRRSVISAVVLVLGLLWAWSAGQLGTMGVIGGILFLIMFHELGHFLAAKAFGMKATEFFVGFGPRLWTFRRGETEYGVRAVPLGGFVKVIGMTNTEEVDPLDEPRTYRAKPFYQRIILALAGPAMNFVLAFVLLWAVGVFFGAPDGRKDTTRIGETVALQGGTSPAIAAGLKQGDRITHVAGTPVSQWSEVTSSFSRAPGVAIPIQVNRDGKSLDLVVTPQDASTVRLADGTPLVEGTLEQPMGFVGISADLRESPIAAVGTSAERLWAGTGATVGAFQQVFSPSGVSTWVQNVSGTLPAEQQESADMKRFISPVGLVNWANSASESGWFTALMLLIAINVSVAVFNLIPLLPFDGGHIAVAIYGWIRSLGRRERHVVDFKKLEPAMYAVVAALILISVSAMWLDIVRPVHL